MTAWQRQASESAGAEHRPSTNGNETRSERTSSFSWEEWFRHASAHQRAEAMGLAHAQGFLYSHQLSRLANGTKSMDVVLETQTTRTLTRLLSGKSEPLPAFDLQPINFFDTELDEQQQQAVCRALSTPDVFLLQGLPGTGKSRVAVEIVLQTAAQGGRVLVLADQIQSLDVLLQRLSGRQDVLAIRYLEATEKAESLPAWLRALTLEEQQRTFLEQVATGAQDNREQTEVSCQQHREEEPIWSELRSCLEQCHRLDAALHLAQQSFHQIAAEVEKDSTAIISDDRKCWSERRQSLQAEVEACEHQQQSCNETLAKVAQEIADLKQRMTALEPAYRAKKEKQFWSWNFWKHLLDGQIVPELESLQMQHDEAQKRQNTCQEQISHWQARRQETLEQIQFEKHSALEAEIQLRQQRLTTQIQSLRQERQQLEECWNRMCLKLIKQPLEPTVAALDAAQQKWQQQRQHDEEQCHFAQQWKEYIDQTGLQLKTRLPMLANVLAGTLASWQSASPFHDAARGPFDLVLIEDADTLTESDLMKAARQAKRCVLIGHTLAETLPSFKNEDPSPRSFLGSTLASAVCWPRLWQALGGDQGTWPYRWLREQEQLVCQLLPLSREDRQYLHREHLADDDEIELRILHRPRTRACLAQIVFPAHWSFEQAFLFTVKETQELPLPPLCRTCWWTEDAERGYWNTAPSTACIHGWIELAAGVRLATIADEQGEAVFLGRIEFDKSAGWNRSMASTWLDGVLAGPNQGRTMFLQVPHRFAAPLAQTLVTLVCADGWLASAMPRSFSCEPAFEFCAVPPVLPPWPKDGAGLELDLSATRHADRLPLELRHVLPARGYVNYLEAQALVRRLEALVLEVPCSLDSDDRIAVLALYESQVELLRRLIAQSTVLRGVPLTLEVALPSQMHQRECDLVLLSLTRSHCHRCVAFGETAQELPLALTRARSRLLVFGDLGMLCKRTHWHGPLDHLDAQASSQECLRLSRLLAYVQQQPGMLVTAHSNGKN